MKFRALLVVPVILLLHACAPVGSEAWCENMDEKPKGDWTGDEAASYTKYCIMGLDPNDDK